MPIVRCVTARAMAGLTGYGLDPPQNGHHWQAPPVARLQIFGQTRTCDLAVGCCLPIVCCVLDPSLAKELGLIDKGIFLWLWLQVPSHVPNVTPGDMVAMGFFEAAKSNGAIGVA